MIEVGRFDTRTDAECARSLLAAAGIPCVLAPDTASGSYPSDLSVGARLLVAEADAYDATKILRHHEPTEEHRR
jgi:Putative prokaryotic signal transducing protein